MTQIILGVNNLTHRFVYLLDNNYVGTPSGPRPTLTVAFEVIHRGVDKTVDTLCRLTVTQSVLTY